ncbi:MAG: electron transfer flavoprotein subunit alpha/FixB family protein, partial [Desulfobacterales bacterium]
DVASKGLVVKEIKQQAHDGIDLTEADIIISGGRGMGKPENFEILFECARVMGAAVGASRAAVDAGWAPHTMQVGQTGATVSPKVYIACGISGSVQHFAGMKTSGLIIAVNTDPEASITKNCDYYIVEDLFEIVPILTRQLKRVVGAE